MPRRLLCLLTLVASSAFTASSAEAAKLKVKRLPLDVAVTTDGSRFAVDPTSGGAFVRDLKTHRLFRLTAPEPVCRIRAVGSGLLLWGCPVLEGEASWVVPHVVDLAERREVVAGGAEAFRQQSLVPPPTGIRGYGLGQVEIGRNWIRGSAEPYYHGEHTFKLNWHTGKSGRVQSGGAIDDLDSASGSRTLCAPVTVESPDDGLLPVSAVGRWTFRWTFASAILQRCGTAHKSSFPNVKAFALTSRYAIWLTRPQPCPGEACPQTLRVRDLRTGSERRTTLSTLGYSAGLSVADRFVYVASQTSSWRITL
jgi:hypothetical protein